MTEQLLKITLREPVSLNQMYATRKRGYGRYKVQEATNWQDEATLLARTITDVIDTSGNVGIDILYYPSRSNRDIDNNFKLLFDALEGVVYDNDKQVRRLVATKLDTDTKRPRIEVTAYRMSDDIKPHKLPNNFWD